MVSFLVLACNAAPVLREFVSRFKGGGASFFVHLDAKIDLENYKSHFNDLDVSVNFLVDRFPIYWGGFNMIRATESLAQHALRNNCSGAIALVSDDALPLWSADKCLRELVRQPNRFDAHPLAADSLVRQRYQNFFFLDSAATSARWLPVEARVFAEHDDDTLSRLAARRNAGKAPMPNLRAGSQWWSLDRRVLQEVLEVLACDISVRESFEFSAIPDEMLFQTLARNALGSLTHGRGPMLVDFSKEPKPFIYSSWPSDQVPSSEVLFVRKVHPAAAIEVSSSIMRSSWYE